MSIASNEGTILESINISIICQILNTDLLENFPYIRGTEILKCIFINIEFPTQLNEIGILYIELDINVDFCSIRQKLI